MGRISGISGKDAVKAFTKAGWQSSSFEQSWNQGKFIRTAT